MSLNSTGENDLFCHRKSNCENTFHSETLCFFRRWINYEGISSNVIRFKATFFGSKQLFGHSRNYILEGLLWTVANCESWIWWITSSYGLMAINLWNDHLRVPWEFPRSVRALPSREIGWDVVPSRNYSKSTWIRYAKTIAITFKKHSVEFGRDFHFKARCKIKAVPDEICTNVPIWKSYLFRWDYCRVVEIVFDFQSNGSLRMIEK